MAQFKVLLAVRCKTESAFMVHPPTGLAAGHASQIVIAKAILIKTKGGQEYCKIWLDKKTAANLRNCHKVTRL